MMAMTIIIIIFRASKVNTSLTLGQAQHQDGEVLVGELVLLLLLLHLSGFQPRID